MLAEENMAEKRLIVGSLEVLQDIKGGNIKTIQRNVDSLSLGLQTVAAKQADFFKNISDDAVITPTEKATLKKELESIVNSYLAILDLAEKKQVLETNELQEYRAAYNDLHDYLYIELRVFDDMSTNTYLQNPETFNEKFDIYYNKEIFANNRCAVGNDYWTLRILDNLSQVGTDNEVALYEGQFYKYSVLKSKWEEVNAAQYLGIRDSFEPANIDDYFLAVKDHIFTQLLINNEGCLTDEEGNFIQFTLSVSAGTIYIFKENGWQPIENRDDWRYTIAQNDLATNGLSFSPAFDEYVNTTGKAKYLRTLTEPPKSYIPGDWFSWGGINEFEWNYSKDNFITLIKGHVYKFNIPTWTELEPSDSRYNNEFMVALNDLIDLNMGTDKYFNNIFVKKIFSLQAVIEELQTKIIELEDDGVIKKKGYNPGDNQRGFYLGANGKFECYDGIFHGNIEAGPLNLYLGVSERRHIETTGESGIYQFLSDYEASGYRFEYNENITNGYIVIDDQTVIVKNIKVNSKKTETGYMKYVRNTSSRESIYNLFLQTVIEVSILINNDQTINFVYQLCLDYGERAVRGPAGEWQSFNIDGVSRRYYVTTIPLSPGTIDPLVNKMNITSDEGVNKMLFKGLPDVETPTMEPGTVWVHNGVLKIKS